jgi:hypothetical protein
MLNRNIPAPGVTGSPETRTAFTEKDNEILHVLDGSRSKQAMPKAAVRLEDLRGLAPLITPPTGLVVSAAPTAADFNALSAQVAALYRALGSVQSAILVRGGARTTGE